MRGLMQATVPNTYAATKASLAVGWGDKRPGPEPVLELPIIGTSLCECGRRKWKGRLACDRCAQLESAADYSSLDSEIVAATGNEPLTIGAMIEAFGWRYPRHALYYACRKLVEAGALLKTPTHARGEMFVYSRR